MWQFPVSFVFLAILVAAGYRRSLPRDTPLGWRDRVWVGSLVLAIGGAAVVGFIFGQSTIPWPDKAIVASIVGAVCCAPLAACAVRWAVGGGRGG